MYKIKEITSTFSCIFGLLAFMAVGQLQAQSDTLVLTDGRVLLGSYKVGQYQTVVENRKNYKEFYRARNVKSLHTSKKYYHSVDVNVSNEPLYFMAERLVDSDVDLYRADFPAGYFSLTSVAQTFFFFERDGLFTYVNKSQLEAFYIAYFGDCYGWMPNKKLFYNEANIVEMLNAYNKCINPNAKQQMVEPVVSGLSWTVFGGLAKLRHYPLNIVFNHGEFKDASTHFGLGINFEIRRRTRLGIEFHYATHAVVSPVFIPSFLTFHPQIIKSRFNTAFLNFTGAYILGFKKFSIQPGASIGVGTIMNYKETKLQPEFFINRMPSNIDTTAPPIFEFEEAFYNFKAFVDIYYGLNNRMAVFGRGAFDLTFTKSIAGKKEGNHAIDGMLLALGVVYKLK